MYINAVNTPSSRAAHRKNWLVIYTRGRWEKKVEQLLHDQDIEAYCPLKRTLRQWADRKKLVDVPLFTSYLFVRINPAEELLVRQTSGVINFIYYQGRPAVVTEKVIAGIRNYIQDCPDVEAVDLKRVSAGDRVKIKSGVLTDYKGQVLKVEGKNIVMFIQHLGCVLVTKVKINNIDPIN